MTPDEIAALGDNVVQICQAHQPENWRKHDYRVFVFVEPGNVVVKYGDPHMLQPEITTQKYVFDYAESQNGQFMERITLTVPSDLIERVAVALNWLSKVEPPPYHAIGPLGGCIRHGVFKDFLVPLLFPSVDDCVHEAPGTYEDTVSPVKISNDRLMFTQSDMDLSNFGLTSRERPFSWILGK
ncbi:hypothetical protein C8F01DRAFT_1245886 [Mycena amicta]|nr:hypothetical protein C8F01DRAFT_1245886 [Mycena amicta]